MKTNLTLKILGFLVIAFVFLNIIVMSDSFYVDGPNNNIYSDGGNVGIGTNTPNKSLHVYHATTNAVIKAESGDAYAEIEFVDVNTTTPVYAGAYGDEFRVKTSGSIQFTISSSGNVGIGTTALSDHGHLVFGYTNSIITVDTTDNSDNKCLKLTGGGAASSSRGGVIVLSGNENTTWEGDVIINPGGNSGMQVKIDSTLYVGDGNVGIGTTTPDYKLEVDGTIHAEKVIVSNVSADFVFEDDYDLRTLGEVESFIEENGHLPEIPSAKDVEEKGTNIGEMNTRLLQKIEELTLYIIDQDKRIAELENKLYEENTRIIDVNNTPYIESSSGIQSE